MASVTELASLRAMSDSASLADWDSRKTAAWKQRVTSLPQASAANALCWKWKVVLALPKGWDGKK